MLITYAASALLRGNGFLSVFVAGLVLNNSDFIHKRSLLRFHDGMAWLMQIAMFLTLGLLVFPSDLLAIMGYGFLLSLFLIFVARPITVFLTLFRVNVIGLRDKMMVGWVGLRGAVPIVLATFPLLYNIPAADGIFDLVFFIVLTSVLGQGTTIPIIARWLGVDEAVRQRRKPPLEFDPAEPAGGDLIEIEIPANSQAVGKQIVQLGLPETALFVLIDRDGSYVVPRGNTFLQAGDNVMVLADDDSLLRIRELIDVPMRSEVVNAPQAQESS